MKLNTLDDFIIIWNTFERGRQRQFIYLLLLIVISSLTEILSIGSLVPFVTIITSEDAMKKLSFIVNFASRFGLSSYRDIVLFITFIFLILVVLGGMLRLWVLKLSTSLSFESGSVLSARIYRNVLLQNYDQHIIRNSSELISNISIKSNSLIYGYLYPLVNIIQSLILIVCMVGTLLYVNFMVTVIMFVIITFTYFLLYTLINKKLLSNSIVVSREQSFLIKNLREGFGSIRDVLLNATHDYFVTDFQQSDSKLRAAQGSNAFLSGFPKYVIETIGVLIIGVILLISINSPSGVAAILPTVVVIAFSSQRMLPIVQILFHSLSSIKGNRESVKESVEYLKLISVNERSHFKLSFKKSVVLRDISFSYGTQSKYVIKDINLEIDKGDVIGFMGQTGSGKSTLVDIISGLLKPTEGYVAVDSISLTDGNLGDWQNNISYLSQTNYILDISFAENIAFGVDKNDINILDVEKAARLALIDTIIKTKGGYWGNAGENGSNLSGGQKQRLALARILFKKSDLIIIDEGTSALDKNTEELILSSITNLESRPTIILITHNRTNLRYCNKAFEIKEGRLSTIN